MLIVAVTVGVVFGGAVACAGDDFVSWPAAECSSVADCASGELCSRQGVCVAPGAGADESPEPAAAPDAEAPAPSKPDDGDDKDDDDDEDDDKENKGKSDTPVGTDGDDLAWAFG